MNETACVLTYSYWGCIVCCFVYIGVVCIIYLYSNGDVKKLEKLGLVNGESNLLK